MDLCGNPNLVTSDHVPTEEDVAIASFRALSLEHARSIANAILRNHDLTFQERMSLRKAAKPEETHTKIGVLMPWGGGGPSCDWDKVNRRDK